MNGVSILERSKSYVVLKLPKKIADSLNLEKMLKLHRSEDEILRDFKLGLAEYYSGKAKKLKSLRALR